MWINNNPQKTSEKFYKNILFFKGIVKRIQFFSSVGSHKHKKKSIQKVITTYWSLLTKGTQYTELKFFLFCFLLLSNKSLDVNILTKYLLVYSFEF